MAAPGIHDFSLSISPDGERVAYVASTDKGTQIWVRRTGAVQATMLQGTENASDVIFWSPDSRSLAFYSGGQLRKINVNGGASTFLAPASIDVAGSWNRDGTILFSATFSAAAPYIARVSESGGEITAVEEPQANQAQIAPRFLPDGHHFLYLLLGNQPAGQNQEAALYLGSLDSRETKKIMPVTFGTGEVYPTYVSPGYLLYSLRTAIYEYLAHYHAERNHQGLDNRLIIPNAEEKSDGVVHRKQRLGGTLSFYHRNAA